MGFCRDRQYRLLLCRLRTMPLAPSLQSGRSGSRVCIPSTRASSRSPGGSESCSLFAGSLRCSVALSSQCSSLRLCVLGLVNVRLHHRRHPHAVWVELRHREAIWPHQGRCRMDLAVWSLGPEVSAERRRPLSIVRLEWVSADPSLPRVVVGVAPIPLVLENAGGRCLSHRHLRCWESWKRWRACRRVALQVACRPSPQSVSNLKMVVLADVEVTDSSIHLQSFASTHQVGVVQSSAQPVLMQVSDYGRHCVGRVNVPHDRVPAPTSRSAEDQLEWCGQVSGRGIQLTRTHSPLGHVWGATPASAAAPSS